jgi:hypothetical protein
MGTVGAGTYGVLNGPRVKRLTVPLARLPRAARFAAALARAIRPRAVVLLAHQPAVIHDAVTHGVDLQLSGHTHGGQMRPGNYRTLPFFKTALASPAGAVSSVPRLKRLGRTVRLTWGRRRARAVPAEGPFFSGQSHGVAELSVPTSPVPAAGLAEALTGIAAAAPLPRLIPTAAPTESPSAPCPPRPRLPPLQHPGSARQSCAWLRVTKR